MILDGQLGVFAAVFEFFRTVLAGNIVSENDSSLPAVAWGQVRESRRKTSMRNNLMR